MIEKLKDTDLPFMEVNSLLGILYLNLGVATRRMILFV